MKKQKLLVLLSKTNPLKDLAIPGELNYEVICEHVTIKLMQEYLQSYAGLVIDVNFLQYNMLDLSLPYVLVADNSCEESIFSEFASATNCVGVVSGFSENSYFLAVKGLIACCFK